MARSLPKPGKRFIQINGVDVPIEEIPAEQLEQIKVEFTKRVIKALGGRVIEKTTTAK